MAFGRLAYSLGCWSAAAYPRWSFPIFSRPNPLIDTNKSAMKFDPDQTLRSVEPWPSEIPSDKNVAGRLNIQ